MTVELFNLPSIRRECPTLQDQARLAFFHDMIFATTFGEKTSMTISSALRATALAIVALVGLTFSARADDGFVQLTIYKGGWIIGGNGGGGVLTFHGRNYSLGIGGIDYGLVFGGSRAVLSGRVHNIWRPSDIAGAYAAGGAGIVIGGGVRGIVLTNARGVVLELAGSQVGLMANADLSGLAISIR
jgi:hypothetical protein